jgi:ribosomal protein S18 acetylase RimI-like enzyme
VKLAGHAIRVVTREDAPALQALFEQDREYWLVIEGAPLRDDEGMQVFEEVPPGFLFEKKHAFLVDDIAFLDMLEGYPDPQTWWLGLIFLSPSVRNAGLGARLIAALADHVRASGGRALRLAVAEDNPGARRFYDRLGFRFVDRRTRTIHTGAKIELDVLELAL